MAAPGQPIPDGFRQKAPVMDMAQRGPEVERDATPELARLTVPQLREMARRRDIEGTDSMRKAELIHALAD